MAQWFYQQNGQQQGPVPSQKLKELAATGSLAPEDLVWREGMKEWVSASSVKSLFTHTPQAEAPKAPHDVIPQTSATPDPWTMIQASTAQQESVPPPQVGQQRNAPRHQKRPSRKARTTRGTKPGQLLTPRRIVIGGGCMAVLLLLGGIWLLSGGRSLNGITWGKSASEPKPKARMDWFLQTCASAGGQRSNAKNTKLYDVYMTHFEMQRKWAKNLGGIYLDCYSVKKYGATGPSKLRQDVQKQLRDFKESVTDITESIQSITDRGDHRGALTYAVVYMNVTGSYDGVVAGFIEAGIDIPPH